MCFLSDQCYDVTGEHKVEVEEGQKCEKEWNENKITTERTLRGRKDNEAHSLSLEKFAQGVVRHQNWNKRINGQQDGPLVTVTDEAHVKLVFENSHES